jgi:hypothetical protein
MTDQEVNDYARDVLDEIYRLQRMGDLPAVNGFDELHEHVDANVGWSDATDKMESGEWFAIAERVDEVLTGATRIWSVACYATEESHLVSAPTRTDALTKFLADNPDLVGTEIQIDDIYGGNHHE